MKKIVIVLGMHRSATSLTTEILASYGLYVGSKKNLLEPTQDNQRGYFENKYVVLLNNKILYEHKMHWASLDNKADITNTEYLYEINRILKNMLEQAEQDQILLLKDPRLSLLEPVWKKQFEAFNLKEYIVMVFRHPYEVAKSLQIRDNLDFSYALKIWFFNNYSALCSIAAGGVPAIILNHNDYFIAYEKQIEKIENFLQWTGENNTLNKIVDTTLRHNDVSNIRQNIDSELNRVVLDMYQYLLELSEKEEMVISSEKLKDFSEKLKLISEKAYLPKERDKEPVVFRNCLVKEKKGWCTYQLRHNFKKLVCKFKHYRKSENFEKCSLYGNGSLTEALLPILIQAGIYVETIYDQNRAQDNCIIGQCQIKVKDINKMEVIEGVLLNTVVNYGAQVAIELSEKFIMCKVLDLYELIWLLLK